jgi:hypothetical protein
MARLVNPGAGQRERRADKGQCVARRLKDGCPVTNTPWWTRLKSKWAPDNPEAKAAAAEKRLDADPKNPRHWLRHAESCQNRGDAENAVQAFRTAAFLFRDARKIPHARAAMKMAIALAPRDEFLLTELKSLDDETALTRPGVYIPREEVPLTEQPTRRLTKKEAAALRELAQAKEDVPLPDFARPTVVDLQLLGLPTRGSRAR